MQLKIWQFVELLCKTTTKIHVRRLDVYYQLGPLLMAKQAITHREYYLQHTQLDSTMLGQIIIHRQLFTGHVMGSWTMKRK